MMKDRQRFLPGYLAHFLYFLALASLGEQVGFYFSPLNKIWGAFFLLAYLFSTYKRPEIGITTPRRIICYLWPGLLFTLSLIASLPAISLGLALLIPLSLNQVERKIEFQTGLVFYLYILFHSFVPQFFLLEKAVADGLNMFLKAVTGLPLNYSPYAYGLGCLIIATGYTIFEAAKFKKTGKFLWTRFVWFIVPLIVFLVSQILYFLISRSYYAIQPPVGTGRDQFFYYFIGLFLPMNGQGVILLMLLGATGLTYYFVAGNGKNDYRKDTTRINYTRWFLPKLSVILLFTLILFFYWWNLDIYSSDYKKPVIYVYDTKMDFSTVPSEKVFGMSNGMFGEMFDYFRDWGYNIQFGSDWSGIKPENHDILILFNPNGDLSFSEKERLKSFMTQGGCLVVPGDHTFMFGVKNGYFDMTKEMGISFKFDLAVYFRPDWRWSLRSPYLTWDLMLKKDNFNTKILQGASLSLKYPASPLIIGQYGWSDQGNLKNPYYLGDRKFTPNEQLGDLVLAAERNYGRGKLLVFGDTNLFQNSPISTSYPLIQLLLSHLQLKRTVVLLLAAPLLFLIAAIFLLVFKREPLKILPFEISVIALFLILIWFGALLSSPKKYFDLPSKSLQLNAGIDNTMYPGFYSFDWGHRGIGGLKNMLYRTNIIPYMIYQYDQAQLHRLDYLFIMEPNNRISREKALQIKKYVQEGGILIVAGGYENRDQLANLLSILGIQIQNIPLSYLSGDDTNLKVRFISAWPLLIKHQNYKTICTAWGKYPLIVKLTEGKGKALFIGDSYFFENRNLEGQELLYM